MLNKDILISFDTIPQKSIFYIGAKIIQILQKNKKILINELYENYLENNKKNKIDFKQFLYSLDWLKILGVVLSKGLYIHYVVKES